MDQWAKEITYINVIHDYFPSTNRILVHVQKQNIPLQDDRKVVLVDLMEKMHSSDFIFNIKSLQDSNKTRT